MLLILIPLTVFAEEYYYDESTRSQFEDELTAKLGDWDYKSPVRENALASMSFPSFICEWISINGTRIDHRHPYTGGIEHFAVAHFENPDSTPVLTLHDSRPQQCWKTGQPLEPSKLEFEYSSPSKQMRIGYAPQDVRCNTEQELIFKTTNGFAACVYPDSVEKLTERGWAGKF